MHIKIISINKHFCRFVQNVNCLKRFTIMNAGDLLFKKMVHGFFNLFVNKILDILKYCMLILVFVILI